MLRPRRRAEDFDERGLLKVPLLFWFGLFLLVRAWWLTGLAMVTEHGGQWMSLFYPDIGWQVKGLVAGVPALAMLFCYPVRGDLPVLARIMYLLMLLSLILMAVCDGVVVSGLQGIHREPVLIALCADLACLVSLWPDARLREVFLTGPATAGR